MGMGTVGVAGFTSAPAARVRVRRVQGAVPQRKLVVSRAAGSGIEKEVPLDVAPKSLLRTAEQAKDTSMRVRFEKMIREAQGEICAALEELDGEAKFCEDAWTRPGGGGGISRVLQDGKVFEKAGVGVSVVYGTLPPDAVRAASSKAGKPAAPKAGEPTDVEFRWSRGGGTVDLAGSFNNWGLTPLQKGKDGTFSTKVRLPAGEKVYYKFVVDGKWLCDPGQPAENDPGGAQNNFVIPGTKPKAGGAAGAAGAGERIPFFAAGISSVVHPRNPHAPTMHFNYRYFETEADPSLGKRAWWFGGGQDISPAYLYEEDIKHFHGTLKKTCDKHDKEYYPKFKKWADEYFFIPHRGERRGLGGVFFDDQNDRDQDTIFKFSRDMANSVVEAYVPIVAKRCNSKFTEKEKEWQQLRRGRYVEFNLVYDRGTTFGLKTGGRIESILMSLPLTASWMYDQKPEPGSPEEKLLKACQTPPDSWM